MHIQVIRNDHAPYEALVKIRDTMDADPRETWYIHPSLDGYYAQAGLTTIAPFDTVRDAILGVAEQAIEVLFPD